MNVGYLIASETFGTGQWTMLKQLLAFSSGRWDRFVIAGTIRIPDPEPIDGVEVLVPRYRGLAFLDTVVQERLKGADVVHVKSGIPMLLAGIASRQPLIYTLHQPDPIWLYRGMPKLNRVAARVMENRFLLSRVNLFVSVSPWVAEWYSRNLGISSQVIPDVIELSAFSYGERAPLDADLTLLSVGDWDGFNGRKQTHRLFGFVARLREKLVSAKLRVVGLSETSIEVLGRIRDSMGLHDAVELRGVLPRKDLIAEFSSADLYITATIVEGFYRPMIEAFACGVPAVVRDSRDLVDPVCAAPYHHVAASGGGVTFDGTENDFVRATMRVLHDYNGFSARARKYAEKFDEVVTLPLYGSVYEKLARQQ
jgi:glycosyltransferase involved in cell wall biosynthesis